MNSFYNNKNIKILEAFKKDEEKIIEYLDKLKDHHSFDDRERESMDTIKKYITGMNTYLSGISEGLKRAHW